MKQDKQGPSKEGQAKTNSEKKKNEFQRAPSPILSTRLSRPLHCPSHILCHRTLLQVALVVLGVHFMKWHVTGDQKEKPQRDGLSDKGKTHQAEWGAPENQQ